MSDHDDVPPPAAPPAEPTVKQLLEDPAAHSEALDPETLAQLHQWFGLPSAMDLPPEETRPEHEVRRAAAVAAVEPWFLSYCQRLGERLPRMFEEASITPFLDVNHTTIAESFQAAGRIGEPREIEISYLLEDDLKECVPQALLRDLHRVEENFPLYLEMTPIAEPIVEVHRHVAAALEGGSLDREPISMKRELAESIRERVQARHVVPWETLGRAVQSEPEVDSERKPSS